MQIFAFGDSITYGSWDGEGGWVDRLKRVAYQYIENNPEEWVEIYNLGIPGNTTDDLLKRFQLETEQRINSKDEHVFIFGLGANDAAYIVENKEFNVGVDDFKRNLRTVLQQATNFGGKVIFLTITPVIEVGTENQSDGKIRKNEFVGKYNEVIKDLGVEQGVVVLDVNSSFSLYGPDKFICDDGLHPNSDGHGMLASLVKSVLGI